MIRIVVCTVAIFAMIPTAVAQTKKAPVKQPVKLEPKPIMKNLLDSFSYAAGLNIAANMKHQGISEINPALMQRAINDVFQNKTTLLTQEVANMKLQEQLAAFQAKKSGAEKAKAQAFLDANKKRAGVTVLPNGLQYEVLKAGNPNEIKPKGTDTVVVHYTGTLIDGKVFDSSVERGEPATFPVGGVIRGWTEILQMMPKGSKWKVFIPSDLAYGDRGAGADITPGAALIFEIELIDVKPSAR